MPHKFSSPALLALIGILAAAPIVRSQSGGSLQCTAGAVGTVVRAEGTAEPLSDIVITCTGGTPTASGVSAPQVNLNVYLSAPIANRSVSLPFSDALLIVDEPHTAASQAPLTMCDPDGLALAVCSIKGTGTGVGTYDGTVARPNVFQARNTGPNSFTFFGLPVDPPANNKTRTFRITNLRANVAALESSSQDGITAGVYINPSNLLPVSNGSFAIATVQPGLKITGGATANLSQCANSSSVYSVSLTEGFAAAFRPRNIAQVQIGKAQGAVSSYPVPLNQNVPGFAYNTESQFYNGASGDPDSAIVNVPDAGSTPTFPEVRGVKASGLADQGTRLLVAFSSVPETMTLRVPVKIALLDPAAHDSGWAILISTGSDGSGPYSAVSGDADGKAALTVAGGVATAVYEVLYSDPAVLETLTIPVTASGTSMLVGHQVTVQVGLAPISTPTNATDASAPLPRFSSPASVLPAAYLVQECGKPDLTVSLAHAGAFGSGGTGTITITVTNGGDQKTSGTVTVVDTLPSGLTASSVSGTGWSCDTAKATCTRTDSLSAAASYPPIIIAATVNSGAPNIVTNLATVSGGGQVVTINDSASETFKVADQSVTILTDPTGLAFDVDGATFTSTSTFQWSPGTSHTVSAASPQTLAGAGYIFANWSDGGAMSHTIVAGSTPEARYVASYRPASVQTVTVGADPVGLAFTVDGASYTSTKVFTWEEGSSHTVSITSPQTLNGATYVFDYWSDGGAMSHTIVAGSSATASYIGRFSSEFKPGTGTPFQCTFNAAVTPTIRGEGLAESVGDVVINCTGGSSTPAGQPIPQANLTLFLGANVTSRLTNGSSSEALLIVDEPHSAWHSSRPLLACGAAGSNDDGTGVCSIVSDGDSSHTYDGTPGHPNVFQGELTGVNRIEFRRVPIDQGGMNKNLVLRFTNLRANASMLGISSTLIPTQVVAMLSVKQEALPLNNPQQTVAFLARGVNSTFSSAVNLSQCIATNSSIASDLSKALDNGGQNGQQFTVQLDEGFPSSWKERNIQVHLSNSVNGVPVYPPDSAQDVPQANYFSEGGFLANGIQLNGAIPSGYGTFLQGPALAFPATRGLDKAGLADSGTRLNVRFSSIPAGVKLFVPVKIPLIVPANANSHSGFAILTQADATGSGAISPVAGNASGLAPLTIAGGVANAVYEVVYTDPFNVERLMIPVAAAFDANVATLGEIAVETSFGPVNNIGSAADSNTPVPRFTGPLNARTAFAIKACSSLTAAPSSVSFQVVTGEPAPNPVQVAIASTGGPVDFTVSSDQPWLVAGSTTGNTGSSNMVSVSVNPSGLLPNTYTGNIVVSAAGSAPLKIGVTLKVLPAPIAVTINTNPPGVFVMINSQWQSSPQTYKLQPGDSLALSTLEKQNPLSPSGMQYVFQSWSDGGFIQHNYIASGSGAVTVTAYFKTQYELFVKTDGSGKGAVLPATGYFDANAVVPLTATADACSAFGGWNPTVSNNSITMNSPKTLTATFNNDTATVAGTLAADGKTEQGQLHFAVTGNRRVTGTNRWRRTYNVTNSGSALTRVRVVLDGPLTNASGLANAEGITSCAKPAGSGFITVPDLASGATTAITLEVTTIDPAQPWSGALRVLAAGKP